MLYYDRDEKTVYLFHSVVAIRLPVVIDRSQFRIATGISCPRHRAILRGHLGELDCLLSRGRFHWWTRPLWGETWRPKQECRRCGAVVGPPLDPNLVPCVERADRRMTA